MESFLIVTVIFLSVVTIVKIIADNRTRSQLIQKGATSNGVWSLSASVWPS